MKFIVLAALGLNANALTGRHRHHHRAGGRGRALNNQVLQQEIEQLQENYESLEKKYNKLSAVVHSFAQSPYGMAGPGGPAMPSPQPFVRGEKQWMDNAQNIVDWEDKQVDVANTRLPYQSTAQTETIPQGPAPYGIIGEAGHLGGPAAPSPQPFVRGEKQWMDNAQNIGDWGDMQMTMANTRIPYQSTAQLETIPQGQAPYGNAGGNHMGPALPSPQPFTRGEKQWMDNAQNIGDWGDNQMTIANTRIPYMSTAQLETLPQGQAPNGIAHDGAQLGGPALPAPQPFVRGEKQWTPNAQNIEDWGINQMEVANARIPYHSTLVQTGDFDDEYSKGVDMNILYEKDENVGPEKVMYLKDAPAKVDQRFLDIQQLVQLGDNDPSKMEGMLMEDPNIPLNLRLVHVETKEGDDLIRIV